VKLAWNEFFTNFHLALLVIMLFLLKKFIAFKNSPPAKIPKNSNMRDNNERLSARVFVTPTKAKKYISAPSLTPIPITVTGIIRIKPTKQLIHNKSAMEILIPSDIANIYTIKVFNN
jgi:hypothetical protein